MPKKIQRTFLYLAVTMLLVSIVPLVVTAAPPAQDDIICAEEYVVQDGDSLSIIADKYLGNILAYPTLVEITNQKNAVDDTFAIIDDANVLEAGWKLCIPAADVEVTLAEPPPVADIVIDLVGEGWAPASFATGAFPPPYPPDSRHEDAWFNENCERCHVNETDGATPIPHDLWTQNCRSCHLPDAQADEAAVAEWAPASFATGAFPPPYPPDSRHEDAWISSLCQTCHEQETDGANPIPHDIWSTNCRSCHVPDVQVAE